MLQIRVISPPQTSPAVQRLLSDNPGVAHVWVDEGAARKPVGDVISCDVVREAAGELLRELRGLSLKHDGAVVVQHVDVVISDAARAAEDAIPGDGTDAMVWEEMVAAAGEETKLSATFLIFMAAAAIIATIGVVMDEPILIVGALVVGPEFGPLVALCVGLVAGRYRAALAALGTLAVGFAVAALTAMLLTWTLTWADVFAPELLTLPRPNTDFIWQPDTLSWIVALAAGIAGMLSLTSRKSGALVGVLVSVTTIPAVANAAAAVAYGAFDEARGSLKQLGINLVCIVLAGLVTLGVQRFRYRQRVPQLQARAPDGSMIGGAAEPGL